MMVRCILILKPIIHFFLTNELNRVVDSNDVIRKEFHAYLDKNKYLSEGEYEVEKYSI